uniref:Uncharacterized protein n=1 Tax=Anopheles maculatus TaxID=74869 RepID=A0A182STZ7_9DIPT
MSTNKNPQRKLSRSERAMVDESETLVSEELKRPKRKTVATKKRSTAKSVVTASTELGTVKEEQQQQEKQQQSESLSEKGASSSSEKSQTIAPLDDNTPKESVKKPKRTPAPKKRATAKQDFTIVEQEPQPQPEPVSENDPAINADKATPNTPIEGEPSKNINYTPGTVERASTKDISDMLEEKAQQHYAFVCEDNNLPHSIMSDTTNTVPNTATEENTAKNVIKPSSSAPSFDQNDAANDNGLLVVMEKRKNHPVKRNAAKKFWKGRPRHHRRAFKKRSTFKSRRSTARQELGPPLPDYTVVPIKKDIIEDVPTKASVPPSVGEPFDEPTNKVAEPETDPKEPFVLYEPAAAATYDNRDLTLPIVKYQCVEDMEDNDYENVHESEEAAGYDDGNDNLMGDAPTLPCSATEPIMHDNEDDSITVITLQNLDDQTHTTCVRTDVGPTVEPTTLINELTPVDIKYDEYEPEDLLLVRGSTVKREQCNTVNANHHATNPEPSNVPVSVQIINYPSPSLVVPAADPMPYIVYDKLEYGSSGGTITIPDQVQPSKARTNVEQSAQYASPVQLDVADKHFSLSTSDGALAGQSKEQTVLFATQNKPCYGTETVLNSPKHEMVSNLPQQQHTVGVELGKQEPCKQDVLAGTGSERAVEQQAEEDDAVAAAAEEEEEDDDDGGFSLEDIDINSLVLVESQDSVNPNRTFYEIYVSNPDTGQLSEKPLDVPAAVIESIRSILESGER